MSFPHSSLVRGSALAPSLDLSGKLKLETDLCRASGVSDSGLDRRSEED